MTTHKVLTGALAVGLSLAVLGACGDDDDAASDEFCDIARQLQATEEQPSDELLDDYVDAAPAEIEDEAERAATAIKEDGEAAFDDPAVVADIEVIEDFEADACGIGREDGDEGDGTEEEDSPVITDDTADDMTGTTTDDSTDDSLDDTDGEDATTTTLEDTASTMTG
jgi:hypothetical protein